MEEQDFKEKVNKAMNAIKELSQSLNADNIETLALIAILQNYSKDIVNDEILNKWDTQYYLEIDSLVKKFSEALVKQKLITEGFIEKKGKGIEILKESMLGKYGF